MSTGATNFLFFQLLQKKYRIFLKTFYGRSLKLAFDEMFETESVSEEPDIGSSLLSIFNEAEKSEKGASS